MRKFNYGKISVANGYYTNRFFTLIYSKYKFNFNQNTIFALFILVDRFEQDRNENETFRRSIA